MSRKRLKLVHAKLPIVSFYFFHYLIVVVFVSMSIPTSLSMSTTSTSTTTTTTITSSSSSGGSHAGSSAGNGDTMIVSSCVCGALSCTIRDVTVETPTIDCHCPKCRRYHVAGFTSYIKAHKDTVSWTEDTDAIAAIATTTTTGVAAVGDDDDDDDDAVSIATTTTVKKTFRDSCHEIGGPVDRVFCSICRTKMATTIVAAEEPATTEANSNSKDHDHDETNEHGKSTDSTYHTDPDTILVNMGPIEDKTVPDKIWMNWQRNRKPCQLDSKAVWPDAKATAAVTDFYGNTNDYPETPPERIIKGSCGCGASTYRIRRFGTTPSQMQHCYCRLCRQFSGSAFQTWVPVPIEDFEWTSSSSSLSEGQQNQLPELIQTTEHGARHMCRACGGVLTIVYHEDDDTIWPAAGGFLDESLPPTEVDMGHYMHRVAHICCIWKQNWYKLPMDGNERISYAC